MLLFSPADKTTLYLGTQYVMKTVDGGLHWETISPDLTGSTQTPREAKPQGPPTIENAKQRGYGVVFTIAPSPLNRDLIWAGSDTGLIHLTRDGGKNWKDVTPPGLSPWSKISFIEASHFDPAVAYAAVDRSRLDDRTPYLYRTRDYGATWQLITNGISAPAFLRGIRKTPRKKICYSPEPSSEFTFRSMPAITGSPCSLIYRSLPFEISRFMAMISSLPRTAVPSGFLTTSRHFVRHWRLEKPTRSIFTNLPRLIELITIPSPGPRFRQRNPLPENPPAGATIDYFLQSPATNVVLEIFDPQQKLRSQIFFRR